MANQKNSTSMPSSQPRGREFLSAHPSSSAGPLVNLGPHPRGLGYQLNDARFPNSATMCYMEAITHREMRNNSAEVLRRVASGESITVTNHGQPVAFLTPPTHGSLTDLINRSQARPARTDLSTLRTIKRTTSPLSTADLIADSRGRW